MIKIILYFCITSFLFSEDILFSTGDFTFYRHDFFQQISHGEWQNLDSLGREDFISSFLGKELAYIDALSLGLDVFPENYIFLEEWIAYHIELGFTQFYLYDNYGSVSRGKGRTGNNESSLNKTRAGIEFLNLFNFDIL